MKMVKFLEKEMNMKMKMINFFKKEIKLLTKEQQESYENTKVCYICKGKFENKYLKDKNIVKLS